MAKDSIATRIKVTKTGKLLRRPMGQGHFKAKNTGKQNRQKRLMMRINPVDVKVFRKYL